MAKSRNYNGFLAGLAGGLNTNVDRYTAYKEKVAELELATQKAIAVEQAKRQAELPEKGLKFFGDYQKETKGYSTVEQGANGPVTKTYPGMDPKAAEDYYNKAKDIYGNSLPDLPGTPATGAPKVIPDPNKGDSAERRRRTQQLKAAFDSESKGFGLSVSALQAAKGHANENTAIGDTQLTYDLVQAAQGKAQVSDADVAQFAQQGGLDDRTYQAFLKAKSGQKFTPEIKKQILHSLETGYKSQEALHTQRESEYRRMAASEDVDPGQVIHEYRPPEQAPDVQEISAILAKPGQLAPDELAKLMAYKDYKDRHKGK